MELQVDERRYIESKESCSTGIFVRAQMPNGNWESVDIFALSKKSLLEWLKSRGGDNRWAEDVCGLLLGHGHLHE